jgi:hypothetical protein
MSIRLKVAAAAAGLAALFVSSGWPTACRADVVELSGGKALPRDAKIKAGEMPSDEVLQEHEDAKVSALGYDVVKLSGQEASAGLVVAVYSTECHNNTEYQAGETAGEQGFFDDAAASFERAAGELERAARQLALYKRAMALAQLDDFDAVQSAIDAFAAEFPKGYFLADLLSRKARGLLAKGDAAGAQAALDAVINAPGMNKRDLYGAELSKIQLFKAGAAGKSKEKLVEAETAFRALLTRVEQDSGARDEVAGARLRALVGIGRMLVFQGKLAEAKPFLEQVIDASAAAGDPSMLAGAYTAFGHVLFAEASATQAASGNNPEARKTAAGQLEGAVLHYLRVTELYGDRADRSDLYDARVSAARVFAAIFGLTNEVDCDAGKNALRFYAEASRMLGGGVERSQVNREYSDLKTRVDKACAKPEPAAEKPPEKPK